SGGNSRLPEAMAAELGDRVHLNAPVVGVDEASDHVRVTAAGATFDADFAVLAIPPPPLRRIAFEPPLAGDLGDAVAGLDLGQAAKVVSEYSTSFWKSEGLSGFTVTDLPFGIGWAATDSYDSEHGLLSQFITGSPAVTAAVLDDATRVTEFQKQL